MTQANPAWVIDPPPVKHVVKEPYKLYIRGRFVGQFASSIGVWARIGASTFGSGYEVHGDGTVDVDDFTPF